MDARKLKEKATEAFAKGKFAKAAEAYAEFCAADPKDLQARLRMGDAWVKAGQKEKAIGAYQFAAEGFAKEGFLPRAIAASKLILELDPSHKGVQKMLAELYARKTVPAPGSIAKPKPVALTSFNANNKHAPIDLPEVGDVPLEIEESASFRKRTVEPAPPAAAAAPEVQPPPAKGEPPPPPAEIELDVAMVGGAVAPEPPKGPPPLSPEVAAAITIEVEPATTPAGSIELEIEVPEPPTVIVSPEASQPPRPMPPMPPMPPPPPPPSAPIYELDVDEKEDREPPPPRPSEPPMVRGTPEISELQKAEESGVFKRTSSGAYELDIEDAPVEDETVVELTQPKAPGAPQIDEAKLMAELEVPDRVESSAPPGLMPKDAEVPAAPASSRLWFPNNVSEPSSEESATRRFMAPLKGGPQTDLERSLEAFSKFDDEIQIIEPTEPTEPPPAPSAPRAKHGHHTFTELELEGDSLLHAVETAATIGLEQRGQEAPAPVLEERMEAPEDPKLEPGALPKIPLFSDLPEDAFIALFERCPLRRLEPTEMIIQQGSMGDSFFVICAGSVKVFRTDGEVRRDIATLNEGAFFGEMALLSGAVRTASVEAASEDTQLLEISAPILTELSHKHPPVAAALKKFCRQRLLTNVMSSSALFAPFSRTERRQLVERFRARDVQKGDVLIKEGQRSDGMYIVLSGEIDVRLGARNVAALKEGDIFGEMSLLTKAPATATCAAARRTSLLRLPREDFDQIVLSHPQILVLVSELTDERTRQNAALASRATSANGEATPMV